jgi:hypothetical protein
VSVEPRFNLYDDALVTFGGPSAPGAVTFHDVGSMQITSESIGGLTVPIPGPLFLQYDSIGDQYISASGEPTEADYKDLSYNMVGPGAVVLLHGDLLTGRLAFAANGGIFGQVNATAMIGNQPIGTLALTIQHAAGDIGSAPGGLRLEGGTSYAVFGFGAH